MYNSCIRDKAAVKQQPPRVTPSQIIAAIIPPPPRRDANEIQKNLYSVMTLDFYLLLRLLPLCSRARAPLQAIRAAYILYMYM